MNVCPATAWAPVNIALVKHWGFADEDQAIPARESLSLALEHGATTTVEPGGDQDEIWLNGSLLTSRESEKARAAYALLAAIRRHAGLEELGLRVTSSSYVPVSGGMASSAAGGAALTTAALAAAGLAEASNERARIKWCETTESISAVRSLRGGVVRLHPARDGIWLSSVKTPLDLEVLSCQVDSRTKSVSSSAGHALARTSPYWETFRQSGAPMAQQMAEALAAGQFARVGALTEADALAMHAVMLSSSRPIVYATEGTWAVWRDVARWRSEGLEGYCTLDAGANPHVVALRRDSDELARRLSSSPAVIKLWRSSVHPNGAHLVADQHLGGEAATPSRRESKVCASCP